MNKFNSPGIFGRPLFFLLLMVVYAYLGIFQVLEKRPVSVHMWAMCDRASVARNYEQISMNFFKPRVHETREKEGITGLEFPLMNYLAAICYKLFGFSEFWYRLLMLLMVTTGLFAAHQISARFLSPFTALIPPFLLMACPVLTYYAASFLPDAASLGLVLAGWLVYFKAKGKFSRKSILLFTCFFGLAALIKVTALIGLIVLSVIIIVSAFLKESSLPDFKDGRKLFIPILIIFAVVAGWYKYANWLSATQNGGLFLMEMKTPASMEEVRRILEEIKKIWLPFYFNSGLRWFIGITFLLLPFGYRWLNKELFLITYGYWAGNICFFILMMEQFVNHDYYIITLLPAVFFQSLLLLEAGKRLRFGKWIPLAVVVLLLPAMKYNKNHQEFRYNESCWLFDWSRYKDYLDVESYVAELGISRNERVISICDDSPNIALYYLNLRGWRLPTQASDDEIAQMLSNKPSYLVCSIPEKLNSPAFTGRLVKIGSKGSIDFYRINY